MWLGVVAVTFFQILSLLSWSNWEPKRGHARRGKRGGRRGENVQSYSHEMMRDLEKNKTEMGANKMMMDESSPLATLGEHIAKLSSLGKANGYGKCKDRLQQKYLCSWSRSRLYTLPYRSLPYLIYFLRGRTGTDHLFPRRDTTYLLPLQPRLLRLAHGGHTTYLFFIQFQYPHSDILKPKKSTCQTVITPTSFHPRVHVSSQSIRIL